MALQKRGRAPEDSSPGGQAAVGGELSKRWPHVLEFLASCSWGDGTSRVTGTVMLLTEGGRWKAWAHDRDSSEGLFVSALTLEGTLDALEDILITGNGDWRPDKKPVSGRR
jgi:hypothetical protein